MQYTMLFVALVNPGLHTHYELTSVRLFAVLQEVQFVEEKEQARQDASH